ncbi:MAG: hypothetical protein A2144_10155 [Chloroflexi bacterium RBG_16_50_9]|nr:MAG: hypothetical protein A2144_10155 [Chloroflexi bacterium RBG_16_50_9]
MPYIVVSVLEGIPVEQKKAMARDIAKAVSKNFGLPFEMVAKEIVFNDILLENFTPAVEPSADKPPLPIKYISINVLQGRTLEQKRGIARDVTKAVAKHLGIPIESEEIAVEIAEVNPENIAHGGILTIDMKSPPGAK